MKSIKKTSGKFSCFLREDDGISFIECALVVSIVAVVGGIALLAIRKA